MGQNRPKNQHTVPQFLLRNFTVAGTDKLFAFDKQSEKTFATTTRNVAAEARFYDFEDVGDASLEPLMTRMESDISPIIDGILRNESICGLTNDDRIKISLFSAVQQLRVRRGRELAQSLTTGVRKVLLSRGIDPGDVVPAMNDCEVKRISLLQIESAKEFSKYFFNKTWILQRAPRGTTFYTSDNPVVLHSLFRGQGRGGGITTPGVEIYFPISNQFSICFLCDTWRHAICHGLARADEIRNSSGTCPVDVGELRRLARAIETGAETLLPENVEHQNSLQVLYSSRFLFCSRDDFALASSMIIQSPKLKGSPTLVVE
jgi:hypothetical protein